MKMKGLKQSRRVLKTPIEKLLVANRGEIACRIIKTAKRLGIQTVSVYSWIDRNSLHTNLSDEAYLLGSNVESSTYMNSSSIIAIAKKCKADAIHPGYGYLSENGEFASMVEQNSLNFVGPSSKVINLMGDKAACNSLMKKLRIPLLEGYFGSKQSDASLVTQALKVGYPLVIKPALGGGGKGIKLVRCHKDFLETVRQTQRESLNYFGSSQLILERFVSEFKHIEVQIVRDKYGNTFHLFDRDCTIQRRFQKIIEEAPAQLPPSLSEAMKDVAIRIANSVQYTGVGTVEFIVDCPRNKFYFMEMNTRLQVEHPVTEGIVQLKGKQLDLVQLQLDIAMGGRLNFVQNDIEAVGHSIEARVYAERPDKGFTPQSGRVCHMENRIADESRIRIDSALQTGDMVYADHDPMIAKVISRCDSRSEAITVLMRALDAYILVGIDTNKDFLRKCLAHREFTSGNCSSDFLTRFGKDLLKLDESFWLNNALSALVMCIPEVRNSEKSFFQALTHFRVNSLYTQTCTLHCTKLDKTIDYRVYKTPARLMTDKWNQPKMPTYNIEILSTQKNAVDQKNDKLFPKCIRVVIVENRKLRSVAHKPTGCIVHRYEVIVDEAKKITFEVFLHKDSRKRRVSLLFQDGSVHCAEQYFIDPARINRSERSSADNYNIRSPIDGKIAQVCFDEGELVRKGEVALYVHAMKMEHEVRSLCDGPISYFCKEGDVVAFNRVVAKIHSPE